MKYQDSKIDKKLREKFKYDFDQYKFKKFSFSKFHIRDIRFIKARNQLSTLLRQSFGIDAEIQA